MATQQWSVWVTLTASAFAMLCAGPIFTFGAIHSDIKNMLGATELQVQLIGVAGDIGLWTKVIPGLVFDRFGARATLLGGSLITLVGYLLMYAALRLLWSPAIVAVTWFLVGEGSGFIYTGALFSSTKSFAPEERGAVTGILACLFGTSATVFGSLLGGCLGGHMDAAHTCVGGVLGGSVTDYILLLAVVVPAVTFTAAMFTSLHEGDARDPREGAGARFSALLVGLILLLAAIFGKNLLEIVADPSIKTWGNYCVLALLACLLATPAGALHAPSAKPSKLMEDDISTEAGSPAQQGRADVSERPAFLQVRFWAMFLTFGITVGGDLMVLNIISPIVKSRSLDHAFAGFLVIVQMGCDTLARLTSGFVVGKRVPLTGLLLCAPVLTVVAHLLLLAGGTPGLLLACALLGLSDGAMWTLCPLFVGQAFGLASVGRNFGVTVLAAAVFQSLLSLGLEPYVYSQHTRAGEAVCAGSGCFAATHLATAALALFAVATAGYLHCAPAAAPAESTDDDCDGNLSLEDSESTSESEA